MKYCIIVGSSRGLGASLAESFLNEQYHVIGIGRTPHNKITNHERWSATGRYQYIEMDITSSECRDKLIPICANLPPEPICVIYNAAVIKPDVCYNGNVDFDIFNQVNRTQIDGFANVISAFEKHFLSSGGVLVGISSFSAYTPTILNSRLAYSASKAYLDMALKCLRHIWNEKAHIITVHLGHIRADEKGSAFYRWLVPSYSMCANAIKHGILAANPAKTINYPLIYSIIYKYILRMFPAQIYLSLYKGLSRLNSLLQRTPR